MTRHAKKSRPLQKPSGRAHNVVQLVRPDAVAGTGRRHGIGELASNVRPGLSCQVESFAEIAHELPPLFMRHWQELGDPSVPLDPDWDRYLSLEVTGSLCFMTVRHGDVLVGYISTVVGPHLHYRSTLFAEIEMFWLDPVYRGSWFVFGWFRENDAMLQKLGVKRVSVAVKAGYKDGRVGSVFKRLGYRLHENVFLRSF